MEPRKQRNLKARWAAFVSLIALPQVALAIAVACLVSVPVGLLGVAVVVAGAVAFIRLGWRGRPQGSVDQQAGGLIAPPPPSRTEDLRSESSARERRARARLRSNANSSIESRRLNYIRLILVGIVGMTIGMSLTRTEGSDVLQSVGALLAGSGVVAIVGGFVGVASVWGSGYSAIRQLRDELPLTRPELVALVCVTGALGVMFLAAFAREPTVERAAFGIGFAVWSANAVLRLQRADRPTTRR